MRVVRFLGLLLLLGSLLNGLVWGADPLPTDAAAVRSEMIKIRRSTNWNDPKAVQAANARIRQLSAQMESARLHQEAIKAGATATEAAEAASSSSINRTTVLDKVEASAGDNQGAHLELNTELRKQIVQEYEEERDPKITGTPYLAEATTLVINVETREGQAALKQLDQFTSVRRLLITGGRAGAPINLEEVFGRARKLPLEELQIANFRGFVTSIPAEIGQFKGLRKLALFNNGLLALPDTIGHLGGLQILLVDANPLASVLLMVEPLAGLQQLGITKTKVEAEEIVRLRALLPQCKVLNQ